MKKMELDDFYDLKHYSACVVCQFYKNKKCTNNQECIWNTLERELKALEIIKECCIVAEYPDNTYELAFCKKNMY